MFRVSKTRNIINQSLLHPHERLHARWVYELMVSIRLLHRIPWYGAVAIGGITAFVRGFPATGTEAATTLLLVTGSFVATWLFARFALIGFRNRDTEWLELMLTEPAERKRISHIIDTIRRADPDTIRAVRNVVVKKKILSLLEEEA